MLAAREAEADATHRAVQRVYPALVRITVITTEPSAGRLEKFEAAGSGAIISPDGHVITNHHVAGKARQIFCSMPDGEKIEATLVGTDPLADIAVLKLKLETRRRPDAGPLRVAVFGDSDRLRIGDTVYAMGSPAAISQSVTSGIVSNTRMILPEFLWPLTTFTLDGEEVGTLVRWIGHDAVIFGGNSGGPLVNAAGEIVGINEIGLGSMGGAIPSNLARQVAEQLMTGGGVKRSWTGLECQPRLRGGPATRGVLVSGVSRGSPAEGAGLRAGDVVTSYDGVPVDAGIPDEMPIFNRLVLGTPVGKAVAIAYERDGRPATATVTTAVRDPARGREVELKAWGITARNLTRTSAMERKRDDQSGVLVDSLRPGGPCGEAKPPLEVGDVIVELAGGRVKDLAGLRQASDAAAAATGRDERVPVVVGFERGARKLLAVVRIGREPPEEEPLTARKAWLALSTQVLSRDLAAALGLGERTGVRVTEVHAGRAADRAGVKVGDVILKLDGDVVRASEPADADVFAMMVRQRRIGTEVALDIVRGTQPIQVRVTTEAPPPPASELKRLRDEEFEFTARDLSFEDRTQNKLGDDVRGVLMERVEAGGWAQVAHVAVGDVLLSVDGKPTPDVATLGTLMKGAKDRKARHLAFHVRRGVHTMFLELEPSWDVLKE